MILFFVANVHLAPLDKCIREIEKKKKRDEQKNYIKIVRSHFSEIYIVYAFNPVFCFVFCQNEITEIGLYSVTFEYYSIVYSLSLGKIHCWPQFRNLHSVFTVQISKGTPNFLSIEPYVLMNGGSHERSLIKFLTKILSFWALLLKANKMSSSKCF